MNRGNQAGQTAISHIPALLWLTLPPPAWGTRQIHYTSFVLLCLSFLSPCHNLVMRKQCWPVEGTCDRRGTAISLPPFSCCKAGINSLLPFFTRCHTGQWGDAWDGPRAALEKDKIFIHPRFLPRHLLLNGLEPPGLKEVLIQSFETVVSWTAFRKWIVAVIALSLGVHAVGHWNVSSERSSR